MAMTGLICISCGTANPSGRERCDACGARLEAFVPLTTPPSSAGFSVAAFGGLLVAYAALLAALLVALPLVLSSYDPQGFAGLAIGFGVWFVVGFVFGRITGKRRYVEAILAGLVTAAAVVPYVAYISDVRALDTASYVMAGILGVMAAGLGTFLGDQLAPAAPPRAAAR